MATTSVAAEKTGSSARAVQDVGQISQWTLMRRRFMENKLSVFGGIILIIMYLMSAVAPFLSPYPYDQLDENANWSAPTPIYMVNGRPSVCPTTQVLDQATFTFVYHLDCTQASPIRLFAPGYSYTMLGFIQSDVHLFEVAAPAKLYILGSDGQGRDMLSRILEGSRISLTVGLVGVALSIIFGAVLGTVSGYLGGATDNLIQRFIELIMSMPQIPLWAAFAAALPSDMSVVERYFFITLILSLVQWTGLARQVRGKVIAYRSLDYTLAARLGGASDLRIILTHMLPNAISHIIVVAALAVPATILGETALSFLGLGMLPPAVSWGVLLRDAQQVQVVEQHTWLLIPAVAVIIAVTCYQFLGDGLRDAADPYS
ncbi:MAG TPA: ABC transporter permease [Chloroflexota bacterium]|nr:ABC transporter permease [Chloroflexota bacterium]